MPTELKTAAQTAIETERPTEAADDSREQWKREREKVLAEDAAVAAYVAENRVTEQQARVALAMRSRATEIFPSQTGKLAAVEAKAAHDLEAVEGERERLAEISRKWDGMVSVRQRALKDLTALRETLDGFEAMLVSGRGGAVSLICSNDHSSGVVLQHLALYAGAREGASILSEAIPAKEKALGTLEQEMRDFAKDNNVPREFWP